jgi:hypothetical protein
MKCGLLVTADLLFTILFFFSLCTPETVILKTAKE